MPKSDIELTTSPKANPGGVVEVSQNETFGTYLHNLNENSDILITNPDRLISIVEGYWGKLTDLTTIDKSNYIAALNEINLSNKGYKEQIALVEKKFDRELRNTVNEVVAEVTENMEASITHTVTENVKAITREVVLGITGEPAELTVLPNETFVKNINKLKENMDTMNTNLTNSINKGVVTYDGKVNYASGSLVAHSETPGEWGAGRFIIGRSKGGTGPLITGSIGDVNTHFQNTIKANTNFSIVRLKDAGYVMSGAIPYAYNTSYTTGSGNVINGQSTPSIVLISDDYSVKEVCGTIRVKIFADTNYERLIASFAIEVNGKNAFRVHTVWYDASLYIHYFSDEYAMYFPAVEGGGSPIYRKIENFIERTPYNPNTLESNPNGYVYVDEFSDYAPIINEYRELYPVDYPGFYLVHNTTRCNGTSTNGGGLFLNFNGVSPDGSPSQHQPAKAIMIDYSDCNYTPWDSGLIKSPLVTTARHVPHSSTTYRPYAVIEGGGTNRPNIGHIHQYPFSTSNTVLFQKGCILWDRSLGMNSVIFHQFVEQCKTTSLLDPSSKYLVSVGSTIGASSPMTSLEQSLPNITGRLRYIAETFAGVGEAYGCFYKDSGWPNGLTPSSTDVSNTGAIYLDASRSDSTYGRSFTVRGNCITTHFLLQAF